MAFSELNIPEKNRRFSRALFVEGSHKLLNIGDTLCILIQYLLEG